MSSRCVHASSGQRKRVALGFAERGGGEKKFALDSERKQEPPHPNKSEQTDLTQAFDRALAAGANWDGLGGAASTALTAPTPLSSPAVGPHGQALSPPTPRTPPLAGSPLTSAWLKSILESQALWTP